MHTSSLYTTLIHPYLCVHTTNKHILCAYKPVVYTLHIRIYLCVHMPVLCLHTGNTHIPLCTHVNLSMYTLHTHISLCTHVNLSMYTLHTHISLYTCQVVHVYTAYAYISVYTCQVVHVYTAYQLQALLSGTHPANSAIIGYTTEGTLHVSLRLSTDSTPTLP